METQYKRPKLTAEEIRRLPNLLQVVKHFNKLTDDFVNSGGWDSVIDEPIPNDFCWHAPSMDFHNNAEDDKFIVVQTIKGRHTLKPNLMHRPFLFRGEKKDHGMIISSFTQENYDKDKQLRNKEEAWERHLVANLKSEEFIALLKTHPLFMMLDRGIMLQPEKRPIFINMNYYGLAQHYGFRTGLVDFSPDIMAAAFFACTKNLGNDKYEPITDTSQNPYGVIYVHKINPLLTFKFAGFSTIGLQLYPRTGAQKGFFFNEGVTPLNVNMIVTPVYFRQDANVSRHIYKEMKDGKALFPDDTISKYATQILADNEVSGETFAHNLYSNQEDFDRNLDVAKKQGVSINWHKMPYFTPEMLHELEQDLKNGLWEQFCNQIYFADERKGKAMLESLLNLPANPAYSHFFKADEYERITAYDADMHRRAGMKSKRI